MELTPPAVSNPNGFNGGNGVGGGFYVTGSGWTVTLTGDMFSDNKAVGGNGGNGTAGSNAIQPNTGGGNGGNGGNGGEGKGAGAKFYGSGTSTVTIINDLNQPTRYPSIVDANFAQGGNGGNGGNGGTSTGTANNSNGGNGGTGGDGEGGGVFVTTTAPGST